MTEVTPIPKKGKPPRKVKQIPQKVRDEVRARSGGRCEYEWDGTLTGCHFRCRFLAVEMHHRRRRAQLGDDVASNLVHLCSKCHRWIHANPAEAYAAGYLTRGN